MSKGVTKGWMRKVRDRGSKDHDDITIIQNKPLKCESSAAARISCFVKKQVSFSMAIRNVELVHECCPNTYTR